MIFEFVGKFSISYIFESVGKFNIIYKILSMKSESVGN